LLVKGKAFWLFKTKVEGSSPSFSFHFDGSTFTDPLHINLVIMLIFEIQLLLDAVKRFLDFLAVTEFHPMLLSGLFIVMMITFKLSRDIAVPGSWESFAYFAVCVVAQTAFLLVTIKYHGFMQQPVDYLLDMILGDSPPQEVTPPSEEVKPLPRKAPKRLPAPTGKEGHPANVIALTAVVFVAMMVFNN
jgi:hypothetical protein